MSHSAAPSGPASAPRILCLHGGGTNAAIFRFQLRTILTRSSPNFRFVFVEAPFISNAHTAVAEIFADFAPFRRWLRYETHHAEIDHDEAAAQIVDACRQAMREDDAIADGEWVAVLGFSQGAKIAASLLLAQEVLGKPLLDAEFKFGVIMAGRCPPVSLSPEQPKSPHVAPAGQSSAELPNLPTSNEGEHVITVPTLHVHGLADPGHAQHQQMRDLWFAPDTARLLEWDGDHRLPVKIPDVDNVLEQIYQLSEDAGVSVVRKM
jgi:predicted esterase